MDKPRQHVSTDDFIKVATELFLKGFNTAAVKCGENNALFSAWMWSVGKGTSQFCDVLEAQIESDLKRGMPK